jgi:hypothetical protein
MVRTYKRLESGAYAVTTDSGNFEIRRSLVGVNVLLSEVRRNSSRGNDSLEPEKGFVTKRNIQASWSPENYYFELISEEGEKRVSLPVSVYVGTGDPASSALSHWEEVGEMEEQLNVSIYLPEDTFDWLWNEMDRRPIARVGFRLHVMLLLAGIEASMYYEVSHNPIRLETKERAAVRDVSLWVSDPEPELAVSPPEQTATFLKRLERSFDSSTTESWLKRILFALIAIAAILLFKR